MAGKFEISTGSNGDYYFCLKAGNGEKILASEGYESKDGCENGISSVRENSQNKDNFEKRTASDDSPYFVLKAGNGQIIGTSEMYSSDDACENGIASVMENAPSAEGEEV